MRKGIEKLAFELSFEQVKTVTIGELAAKYEEPTERLIDALDVLKLLRGEHTQIPTVNWNLSPEADRLIFVDAQGGTDG